MGSGLLDKDSSALVAFAKDSLLYCSGLYRWTPTGDLVYAGERPGPGWHGHGYLSKTLVVLHHGTVQSLTLLKHRWLRYGTTETRHSRPPDDVRFGHFCTLILVLKLWAWLSSAQGVHTHPELLDSLQDCGSPRSQLRWLKKALKSAMRIQQACRQAVLQRCEPRPVERFFPEGLSPPRSLARRGFKDEAVTVLWRGLTLLIGGALALGFPIALLLAEARGGWDGTDDSFPI